MQKKWSTLVPCAIAASLALTLTACGGGSAKQSLMSTDKSSDGINQAEICETNNLLRVDDCKPGQKVAFLPSQFGNQQLPVVFAAINCDLRYSVVQTNGGVTCIYLPIKPKAPLEAAPSASSPASAAHEPAAR